MAAAAGAGSLAQVSAGLCTAGLCGYDVSLEARRCTCEDAPVTVMGGKSVVVWPVLNTGVGASFVMLDGVWMSLTLAQLFEPRM